MNSLSRRQLLKTFSLGMAFCCMPNSVLAVTRPALFIPPLIDNRRGRPVILTSQETRYPLDGQHNVEVWGFNGQYLGPTIKTRSGSFVKLNYHNQLTQNVALSIQGLQVTGELFGGLAKTVKKGQSWLPILPLQQEASTCWYRATTLGNSAYQTYRGLVGMWIIEDEKSQKSNLPQKYGVNDIPVILQDMTFNNQGIQLFKPNQAKFMGNRLLVNGRESPFVNVPRGWIRLRLLNASLSRIYPLHFADNREMLLIAKGLGFLPQAQPIQTLTLAPGERAEILVDMNEGGNVALITGAKQNIFERIGQFFSSSDNLVDNSVLELRPEGDFSVFKTQPVTGFTTKAVEMLNAQVAKERAFHLDVNNGLINQKSFNPRRIDVQAKLGTIERWILTSSSEVGFTLQGAKFILEQQDGINTQVQHLAWQDTVLIKGKTQILVKFDNLSSNNYPFIFGTSNLALADMGCIALLVVQ